MSKAIQHKAVDVSYDRMTGPLDLTEINQLFSQGWTLVDMTQCGSGNILAVLEKEIEE